MLARLLLVLLLAAFSLPAAAAACHDMPVAGTQAMAMTGDHHSAPAPESPMASHACVGCVPPSDLLAARIEPPLPAPAPAPAMRVTLLDLSGALPPDLPPPRRG